MRLLLVVLISLSLSLLVASSAFAQERTRAGGAGASSVLQVTEYDFEGDLVTGDLVRPDGELVGARRKSKVSSLIRVRKHFIPEMLRSVENL